MHVLYLIFCFCFVFFCVSQSQQFYLYAIQLLLVLIAINTYYYYYYYSPKGKSTVLCVQQQTFQVLQGSFTAEFRGVIKVNHMALQHIVS